MGGAMRMEAWMLTAAGWLLAPVCSALIVALVNRGKKAKELQQQIKHEKSKHDALVDKGMKVLLRRELVDAYRDHVTNGIPLTVERFHEITEVHAAYNGFGGNGTGDAMYEAIAENRIHIVR